MSLPQNGTHDFVSLSDLVKMALLNAFNWTSESTLQAPTPKTDRLAFHVRYTKLSIALLVLGVILVLSLCIYLFAVKVRGCERRFATLEESPMIRSIRRKQFKRRKTKKSSKTRLTKAQRLEEANRKWYEIYGSDHSDCNDQEDLATVPFGTVEIKEAKKVSFRESIKDVHFIESKEEMRLLEQLQRLGYDITIAKRQPSCACEIARERPQETPICEDKGAIFPLLNPPFNICQIYEQEGTGVTPKPSKKWLSAEDFEMEGSKAFDDQGLLNHHVLDNEEKLVNLPLLTETSV